MSCDLLQTCDRRWLSGHEAAEPLLCAGPGRAGTMLRRSRRGSLAAAAAPKTLASQKPTASRPKADVEGSEGPVQPSSHEPAKVLGRLRKRSMIIKGKSVRKRRESKTPEDAQPTNNSGPTKKSRSSVLLKRSASFSFASMRKRGPPAQNVSPHNAVAAAPALRSSRSFLSMSRPAVKVVCPDNAAHDAVKTKTLIKTPKGGAAGGALGELLRIVKAPETAINAAGDGVVWEASFEATWTRALTKVLQNQDRASVCIAFLAIRSMHTQCDVELSEEHLATFLSCGKLHSDEIVAGPARETLLTTLLRESPPPLQVIERLLKFTSNEVAINPQKRDHSGQTALQVFVQRVCEEDFFHAYLALGENPSFTTEVLCILVHLEKAGFFACVDTTELRSMENKLTVAVERCQMQLRSLRDDATIRSHVDSLRQMQPWDRATLHAQNRIARSFQLALKYHAEEVKARGIKVLALLGQIRNVFTERLRKRTPKPTIPPVLPKDEETGTTIGTAREAKLCSESTNEHVKMEKSSSAFFQHAPSLALGLLTLWELIRRAVLAMQICESSGAKSRPCRSEEQSLALVGIVLCFLLMVSAISAVWYVRAHKIATVIMAAFTAQSAAQWWAGSLVDGLRMVIYVAIAIQCCETWPTFGSVPIRIRTFLQKRLG
ncbi:Hypothetical Protein FCC1311_005992 [Hondaea fermentalgiana]|uniref:Uncharacterized protein n=1 Tax=Hondaea fermentalgiana TaxID=2315210 RepID=A0A2R5G8K4_9STRA|nr:Hypothetical Protein FCC1311_005992 [Hondaea fermentalgiana]|eukprot:GBG24381.1 Hypothetical Protein FCC1311_005992 [Hondaea fermentalgiana]